MSYAALKKDDALKIWPVVEPLIKRATDRDKGRSSTDTIRTLIENDQAVLWVNDDLSLVWVTSIEVYRTGVKACLIRVCGGQGLDICKEAINEVDRYARYMGCDLLEIYGREGWLRTLEGFAKDITVMSRQLK